MESVSMISILYISVSIVWQCEAALILPTLSNEVTVDLAVTHVTLEDSDIIFNQIDTVIFGLDLLVHDLSYNCLSGNFILGLRLDNSTIAEANYFLDGTVPFIFGPVPLNASGVINLSCDHETNHQCLLIAYGDILPQHNNGIISPAATITTLYFRTVSIVEDGYVAGVPIIEGGDYFITFAKALSGEGTMQNSASHFQNYLNDVVLSKMTMTELVSLTHGTCNDIGGKSSFLPDLPDNLELEPVTLTKFDSYNNLTFQHQRTISDLSAARHDFSYSCMNTHFELTILTGNLTCHGPFHLEGQYGYDNKTVLDARGQMVETCPVESIDADGNCKLVTSGYIREDSESGELILSTFGMFYPLRSQFVIEEGLVNGHDWQQDQESIDLLSGHLMGWTYDIRNVFYDVVEFELNQLLEGMTMAQLLDLTGGTCKN